MFKKQTACSCDGEKSSNNQQKSKTSCHNQNNGCNDEDKNGQEKHQKIKHMEISIHNCNSTNSNNTTSNNNCNINNNTGNNNNTTSSNNNNSSHNISSSTLENSSQPTPRRKSTVLSVLRKFSIHSHNMGNMENQDKSPRRKSSISLAIVRKFSNFSSSHRRNGIYVKGITIPSNCKFKFVVRTVRRELTVSFMLPGMPGYALTTNKTDEVYAEKVINDPKFWERCSFHPCINMWYEGFCAFESVREASRFVLFTDGLFYFKKYDGTEQFKKDASFVFSKQVPDFMPRRSQSNISPPQLTKFQHLTAAKPRKFSLMSFRSMRTQNTRSSKLDTMIPLRNTTDVPYSDDDVKKLQKSELFSLGYNECITCLHLTAYNCKTWPCHHGNDGDYCDELVRKISLVSIESSSSSESSFLTLP